MPNPLIADDRIRQVAEELSGSHVHTLTACKPGANSRIFRLETASGRFALKSYPARANDVRSRAEVEWKALEFLRKHCGDLVPMPLARDAGRHFLLMEWIDGEPVVEHRPADVAHAARFIEQVFAQSRDPEAAAFPAASEACLSAKVITRQIEDRLALLDTDPAIQAFLGEEVLPALAAVSNDLAGELATDRTLEATLRRLIPADFGFHNAIRAPGGLRYIDFDYFGWDDPVKLIADFLLHPAMNLNAEDRHRFIEAMTSALAEDSDWLARLQRHLPLYALRWVLILFNPFRRDRVAALGIPEQKALIADRMRKAHILMRSISDRTWLGH